MNIKSYKDFDLTEAFNSDPYPFRLEDKSTSMDRWYIIETPQGNYRMWFEVQKALGPKAMRIMLGQAAPQQKVFKKIIQNFKDPMKVISTMFAVLRMAIKDDQYVRQQDGLALAVPSVVGDRFDSLINRALTRALTGTPFEVLPNPDVYFQNDEFDYLPIVKKGKKGSDVFKGKDVHSGADVAQTPASKAAPAPAPTPAPKVAPTPAPAPTPVPKAAPVQAPVKNVPPPTKPVAAAPADSKEVAWYVDTKLGRFGVAPKGIGLSPQKWKELKPAKLAAIATDDYQNRQDAGRYPRSDVPDTIEVFSVEQGGKITVRFQFKDFSGTKVENWVSNYLRNQFGVTPVQLSSYDVGDYAGDWANVDAVIQLEMKPTNSGIQGYGAFKAAPPAPAPTPAPAAKSFYETPEGKAAIRDLFDGFETPTKAKLYGFIKKYGSQLNWSVSQGLITGVAKDNMMFSVSFKVRSTTTYKTKGRLRDPNGTAYTIFADSFSYAHGNERGQNYKSFNFYRGVGESKYSEFGEKKKAVYQELVNLGMPAVGEYSLITIL